MLLRMAQLGIWSLTQNRDKNETFVPLLLHKLCFNEDVIGCPSCFPPPGRHDVILTVVLPLPLFPDHQVVQPRLSSSGGTFPAPRQRKTKVSKWWLAPRFPPTTTPIGDTGRAPRQPKCHKRDETAPPSRLPANHFGACFVIPFYADKASGRTLPSVLCTMHSVLLHFPSQSQVSLITKPV